MEPQYVQNFTVDDMAVDRFGYLKPSVILFYAQEVAGEHCKALALDYDHPGGNLAHANHPGRLSQKRGGL